MHRVDASEKESPQKFLGKYVDTPGTLMVVLNDQPTSKAPESFSHTSLAQSGKNVVDHKHQCGGPQTLVPFFWIASTS